MKKAQDSYKKYYDRGRRSNPIFKIGDEVWLSATNLKLSCPSRKLGPRFIGPFKIKRVVNPVAFELSLPSSYRIHPVFHTSLLKPVTPSSFPGREKLPPPPINIEGEDEFEVEAIMDCRRRGGHIQYLVKWKGYPPEDNSWEPSSNIHAPRLIQTFHKKYPGVLARLGTRRLPFGGGHCQKRACQHRKVPVRLRGGAALRRMRVSKVAAHTGSLHGVTT